MKIVITEEQSKKLFIPRKLNSNDSRYTDHNNSQPMVDGKRINQYDYEGNKQGYWESYHYNGSIYGKGNYINGKKDGYWLFYTLDGVLEYKENYSKGNIISAISYSNGRAIKTYPITENKKLFIPRKLSNNDSRYSEHNNAQPIKDGIRINQYDIDGNKQGYWESYYSNGKLNYKGSYVNGEREGYWGVYYENGELYSKGNYMNGKRDDIWEYYHSNGKLISKGNYVNDKADGIWEYYNPNGELVSKSSYINGKLIKELSLTENKKLFIPRKLSSNDSRYTEHNNSQPIKDGVRVNQYDIEGNKTGYWEEYYNNGNLHTKGNYVNGNVDGYWEYYHRNGNLLSKGNYVDGERYGYWEIYYSNGKINSKGSYKNGEREGYLEEYYANGQLSYKGSYKNGYREGYWESYYDNGKLYTKGSYKDGNKSGIWEEYWDNGKLDYKGNYVNGKLIKKLPITENKKLFIPRKLNKSDSRYSEWNNAQPMVDGVRINQYDYEGNKTGIWEDYWGNGKLFYKGSYKNNDLDGYWEVYHSNGQLMFKGSYKDGGKDGYCETYNDNGGLYSKGNYKNGELIQESPLTENKKFKKKKI
jgi:uncharacterized protein